MLQFPKCDEEVIAEVQRAIDLPNKGPINGVENTVSFGRFYWKCGDYVLENHRAFLERGYFLFDTSTLELETHESRVGLVRTTDTLQIVELMACGGSEIPNDQVKGFVARWNKHHQMTLWKVGRWAAMGWMDLPLQDLKAYANEVKTICPSLPKNLFGGMRGFMEHLEASPGSVTLEWDQELEKPRRNKK